MADYQPGVCNIGESEQRRRYGLGAVAAVATLGLVTWVLGFDGPSWALALAVVPLFGAAEGYFQGRYQFCAGFASLGIYDVSPDGQRFAVVEMVGAPPTPTIRVVLNWLAEFRR